MVFGLVVSWVILQKEKVPSEEGIIKQETITEQQLRKLEELKKETQPLTEEEIKAQLEELEKLRLQ